jgi:serine/threonine protein kinase
MEDRQVVANRFELDYLIGEGGVGRVYKGLDTQTGEPVAIKVLRPEVILDAPDLVERFRREGEVLRELNHPNIVTELAMFEEAGQHYIIMEYVPGGSLADLLRNQPQLPLELALAIGLEVADALARAHHLDVIHRDIKPGNILLAEDGTPRLTDFGLAHIASYPPITTRGDVIGTFQYLSPEGCNRQPLDERTEPGRFPGRRAPGAGRPGRPYAGQEPWDTRRQHAAGGRRIGGDWARRGGDAGGRRRSAFRHTASGWA